MEPEYRWENPVVWGKFRGFRKIFQKDVNESGAAASKAPQSTGKRHRAVLAWLSGGRPSGALTRRLIVQIRPEPALRILECHVFALRVIGNLVGPDLAQGEIARFRMRKIKTAYA